MKNYRKLIRAIEELSSWDIADENNEEIEFKNNENYLKLKKYKLNNNLYLEIIRGSINIEFITIETYLITKNELDEKILSIKK